MKKRLTRKTKMEMPIPFILMVGALLLGILTTYFSKSDQHQRTGENLEQPFGKR